MIWFLKNDVKMVRFHISSWLKVFKSKKYLQAAERCADVIWKRGLLKAGYGLCHGVSGNAYAFLAMYQETGDVEYLKKAKRFCNFACDYGRHGCPTPDSPFSLFEGMSGVVYFLDDMEKVLDNPDENIKEATFPCYYVSGNINKIPSHQN